MPRSPVSSFVISVLLWLPLAFTVWYFLSPLIIWPVAAVVGSVLSSLFPDVISAIQPIGRLVEVAVHYSGQDGLVDIPQGQVAELVFEVNALVYGYCVPFYAALLLATPDIGSRRWSRWIVGGALLVLTQSWGVGFHIMKILLFELGPEVAGAMALEQWQYEAVALGYQFGFLILPAVGPVVLWMGFHGDYLKTLVPHLVPGKDAR